MEVKTELWNHQSIMLQHMMHREKTLMVAGCGTGKTLAAFAYMGWLEFQSYRPRFLVLTVRPAVSSVWEDECTKHVDGLFISAPLRGTIKDRIEEIERDLDRDVPVCVVVNYEAARRMPLQDWDFTAAFADESHRLKANTSKQSQVLADKCKNIRFKVAMTGTSWDDRPTDVFGQMRWLRPGHRSGSGYSSYDLRFYGEFFNKYTNYYELDRGVKVATSYKNLDQLASILLPYLLVIDSDEVLELPEEHHVERIVDLSPGHMRKYREMEDNLITNIGATTVTADFPMVKALRLHQMAGGFWQDVSRGAPVLEIKDGDAKLQALLGILDEIDPKEPVVIFTRFEGDVKKIEKALDDCCYLTGNRNTLERWKSKDKAPRILVANMGAGSTGVDLSRARYAIYYSTGYSRSDYQQSLRRLRRPGARTDYPVTYFHILARGTVDLTIRRIISNKGKADEALRAEIEKLVGDYRPGTTATVVKTIQEAIAEKKAREDNE